MTFILEKFIISYLLIYNLYGKHAKKAMDNSP